jgi:hypothetical protein
MTYGRSRLSPWSLLGLLAVVSCGSPETVEEQPPPGEPQPIHPPTAYTAPAAPFLLDISAASGIQDQNYDPAPATAIAINDHSLVAFVDLDGDGLDDVVASNLYPNADNAGTKLEHLVFANQGNKTFANVSDASGIRDLQAGVMAFGDLDNDGDQDLFAGYPARNSTYGHSVWLNDGLGHFTEVPNAGVAGLPSAACAGGASLADFNGDGRLDLYIANGHTAELARDLLYFGNGDGTFTDGTSALQDNKATVSNSVVTCDFDDDGDQDIFVSTYGVSTNSGHNVLWRNDGGTFVDVADATGFAFQKTGNYHLESTGYGTLEQEAASPDDIIGSNGFGIACGDVNNDGYLDIWLSAISHPVSSDESRKWSDPTQLLINTGAEGGYTFRNEFLARGLPFNEGDVDADLADFDNDGRLDLTLSRDNKYEGGYPDDEQKGWFGLMHQLADGQFESVGLVSGINDLADTNFERMGGAQGHAWSDIDLDGDLDLLVGGRKTGEIPTVGRPNFLFENLAGSTNAWIKVRLVGDGQQVNRDAMGARVTLVLESGLLVRELHSSRGNWNAADTRLLHFGVADVGGIDHLEVRWPDGRTDTFTSDKLAFNRILVVSYADGLTLAP